MSLVETIGHMIAGAPSRPDAEREVLRAVGEALGWPMGRFWKVEDLVLRCVDAWNSPTLGGNEAFAACRGQALTPGQGLAGSVWQSGAARWVADLHLDVTPAVPALAARAGLQSAIAFPITSGEKVLGVLEFFCLKGGPPDEELLRFLRMVGTQLGLFVQLRAVEESLRESEERVRLLLESSGEGVYGIDLEGNCLFINPAGARLLGYDDPAELVGKPAHETFHHHRADGRPYPRAECRIDQAVRAGKGVHVDDEVFWHRDGSSFRVEYWANPVRHDVPHLGAVITFVDTTTRRKTDETMRLRESALRAIGQGVFITDPSRVDEPLSYVNAAFENLTGYKLSEVKGRDIEFLRGPQTDPAAVEQVRAAYQEGREATVEVLLYRKSGDPFWATLAVAPVTSATGSVTHFVGVLTEITERKRFEEQLLVAKEAAEAANLAKSRFLASMTHELRTPLNAVIMYSELLQEEAEDRGLADFVPDLEKIRMGGKHLLALVNGVLDLSKIEAGKMELALETFDIGGMLQEVVSMVEPLVGKRGNTLKVECAAEIGSMHADLTKVRQILFNLVSNACKFTENGTVALEALRQDEAGKNWVTFRVRDTGIGMSAEQVGKLFRPFTQADASTTRKYGGTGLGLAISKHFCEMMGGEITVCSKPHEGSTFTVRLPAQVAQAAGERPAVATAATPTVLVIDDDPAVREFMTRSLANDGVHVVTAADGEDGLRLAADVRPSVIFLDVLMPRMDGWAVLSALKADPALADVPVVLMTILNETEMGYVLGASEYLTKPIDRQRLATLLQKYRVAGQAADVLVVDDDEATRQVIRRTLAREGWKIAEAENGRTALEHLSRHRPSLILLDLLMPEMDGFEFLNGLRQQDEWNSIPVVVLTSKDLSAGERQLLSGNVQRILQKGAYGREALLREVRRAVAAFASPTADDNRAPAEHADSTAAHTDGARHVEER